MEEERVLHRIIRELCLEMDIKMEKLSYDWILQLSKDGKVRHIAGSRFDLNPEAAGNIACDKYGAYSVLKSQDVPVIDHVMLFNPKTRGKYVTDEGNSMKVVSEFLKHKKLVIKGNQGSEGRGVFLCKTLKEAEVAIQELFKKNGSISICPCYDIKTEYRTFFIKGQVALIYGKTKPYVIGDGKRNLLELIEELNLPEKSVVKDNLHNIDFHCVPNKNEKIEISWKFNLSGGATPKILEKSELYDNIEKLSIQAGKAMNINFASIDIIHTQDDELYVLEINSGICSTHFTELVDGGYDMVKDIYRKALEEMFK